MQVGVKVGPQGYEKVLTQTKAQVCEVWFRLDWSKEYTPLFKYLKQKNISFGLHFWAMVDNKYFPGMLTFEKGLAEKTYNLIKKTIDIAQKVGATYVTFHPESYHLNLLDLNKGTIKTLNPKEKIDKEKSFKQLLRYLKKIKAYAKQKRVTPLIETVPKYMPSDYRHPGKGIEKSQGLETEKYFILNQKGFPICLDIGHTLAQLITNDKKKAFTYLMKAAKKMKRTIKVLHVTTNKLPCNGTDSHHGVQDKDFKQGVVPNKEQLKQFLKLFKNKDVWLIPEPPAEEMINNFFSLQKIAKSIV